MRDKKPKVRKNRLKKNTRQRRERWLGRIVLALKLSALIALLLGTSALFVMGYAAVTESDYFRARSIEVIGNHRLAEDEILAKAGVRRGDNVLALNLRIVRGRLLDHPWIASARVTRDIPRSLVIEIREHEPLACIAVGRRSFLLSTQGRLFKEAASGDPQDLPVISGIDPWEIDVTLSGPGMRAVMDVLQLGRQPGSAFAYEEMQRLELDPEAGISITLNGNRRVRLGFGEYELKYDRFKQLRRQWETGESPHDFTAADLTNPDRVVVRLESDNTL